MIPSDLLEAVAIDLTSPSGLVWVKPTSNAVKPGQVAGSKSTSRGISNGWTIRWKKTSYKVHRVILQKLRGPSDLEVDHINRNNLDNRPENLRYATRSENCKNRRSWTVK